MSAREAAESCSTESPSRFLFDLASLDLSARVLDKPGIERWIPHRGNMSLLDGIVWKSDDSTRGVAVMHIRPDAFWTAGHFPAKPILPGVLMVEAGAQLACYLYNVRQPTVKLVAFLRIEAASFRSMVQPGDDLYLLCLENKYGRRRFVSTIQGVVEDRLAFDATISGMSLE